MKKSIVLLLLAGITLLSAGLLSFRFASKDGKGIEFFEGSFDAAKREAKKSKKLIFLDAYASWCGPCKRMSSSVFTDANVGAYFNKNFVNLKIDMEKGEGKTLSRQYQVEYYPTLFFLDAEGKVVKKIVGYRDVVQLLAEANSVK